MKRLFFFGFVLLLTLIPFKSFSQSYVPELVGYVQAQYTYAEKGASTFQIRRARFDIKGNLGKTFDYRFQTEFANSCKLVDAYLRVKINPAFNIQLGQFKVQFSLESVMGPFTWEGIDVSQAVNKLSGYSDVSGEGANGRDLGLSIYGGFFKQEGYNIVDYSVGVFNGNGINTKDNNTQKNIAGKVEIHPIKPITVAGSFYFGKMNGIVDPAERMPKNRYAVSFRYDDKTYLFRAEYLRGKTDMGETNPIITDGYYAILGYTINKTITPILRYDAFRNDISSLGGNSTYYMAGLIYQPYKFLRMQLNYTLKYAFKTDKLTNQVTAMVSFQFTTKKDKK